MIEATPQQKQKVIRAVDLAIQRKLGIDPAKAFSVMRARAQSIAAAQHLARKMKDLQKRSEMLRLWQYMKGLPPSVCKARMELLQAYGWYGLKIPWWNPYAASNLANLAEAMEMIEESRNPPT